MSQDFLSQEEVDALLKGVTDDSDGPQAEEPADCVRPYDLATQARIVSGRMPTLELIHERFARNLRLGLFSFMHRNAEISIGPIRVEKFGEFVRNLVVPTNLNLVQAKPLRGTGLIVFDPNLVSIVVDNMFGGDGRFHTPVEGREFTPTEQRIIRGLLGVVFAEYEKAWSPVFEIKFDFVRSETNHQFANIATPSDVSIATTFTLEFGGATADMHICFPYSMIEPIRDVLNSPAQSDQASQDARWTGTLTRQLQGAEVDLVSTLGSSTISLRQILHMKAGDVIPLQIPERISGAVDGVPVVECQYGVQNGRYALRIERFLNEPETAHAHPGEHHV